MSYVRPRHFLHGGETLGFISPSSSLKVDYIDKAEAYFKAKGFQWSWGKHAREVDRFMAGSDAHRAYDLMQFFEDSSVRGIVSTCGGYGSMRFLDLLNYDKIQDHPKIFTGFSDTTSLQLALLSKAKLVTYSGFTFRDLQQGSLNELIERTYWACLTGQPYVVSGGTCVHDGEVQGPLIGGTLTLVASLLGTPYFPQMEGAILLLEDVFAEPYSVDRSLSQLRLAGVFDQVAAVVFGQFHECISKDEADGVLEDVIDEWCQKIKVPCVRDFPYGHGDRRAVLPIGGLVELYAGKGTLSVL